MKNQRAYSYIEVKLSKMKEFKNNHLERRVGSKED